MEKCRWGILGCANIARKNVRAIALSSNSVLTAVASRSLDKANAFCRENNLTNVAAYGSYDELLAAGDVDAVYLPLPTSQHIHWALRAAAAGKHILLEKPAALNVSDLHRILEGCEAGEVLFMDGVMFAHHDRIKQLQRVLRDPFTGSIHRIHSSFSFYGSKAFLTNNIRTSPEGDPLGCLGDLGWYCIYLAVVAFNASSTTLLTVPTSASATCHEWHPSGVSSGVPIDVTASVNFGDKLLVFDCSFIMPFRQRFEISCTPSTDNASPKVITCDDFVIPKNDEAAHFTVTSGSTIDCDTRVVTNETIVASQPCCQEAAMFSDFSSAVLSANSSGLSRYANITLAVQAAIDACYISMRQGGKPAIFRATERRI